jgi:hypothetical protein
MPSAFPFFSEKTPFTRSRQEIDAVTHIGGDIPMTFWKWRSVALNSGTCNRGGRNFVTSHPA